MKGSILVTLLLSFITIAVAAVVDTRVLSAKDIVKVRCSLNTEAETLFFFNGSVIAYPTGGADGANRPVTLFKTVGLNVGRCWKRPDGSYALASREFLYYIDPVTDKILDQWVNPWFPNLGNLTVAHVDNDPVLQNFTDNNPLAPPSVAQVYDDKAFLNLDIPLYYPNTALGNLYNGGAFSQYSPQNWYQAGEFFKFIFPVANLDQDVDTVDYSLVSWTRQGPWLPWMSMGTFQGHLIYSSSGAKIPSWEYLPGVIRADVANRIPHYKHAPTCLPATSSVTSWSFFKSKYNQWLAGAKFPLATPAAYSCVPGYETVPLIPNDGCLASASVTKTSSWVQNGVTHYGYDIQLNNQGTKSISAISVTISGTTIDNSWNINRVTNSNTYTITLWNPFAAGTTLSGSYGFNSHGAPATVTVASVSCSNN